MTARRSAWLAMGCLLMLAGTSPAAKPSPLAQQAQQVLRTHCYKCHGEEGSSKGGLNFILDRDKLVARGKVVAGNPGESSMYMRVSKGEMPPGKIKQRPSPKELATLQRWIEAGAPAFEQVPRRNFISEIDIVHYINDDLRRITPRHRRFMRYLTFANLANANLPERDLEVYRLAMNKLINSLSWHPRITNPTAIDPAKTVYRIDMRDYLWNERTWTRILALYPHYLPQKGSAMKWVASATRTELPYVRADWFVANVSRPPLYLETLELPLTDRDLERLVRVDVVKGIKEERVARAGFNGSGIARNNRVLERHDSAYGAYWRSYDFSSNLEEQNIFERPLGPLGPFLGTNSFVPAGGEIIFHLPNGLQGYFIVDANGRRLDRAPVEIVSDPKRPDKAVETGISCMSCHVRGLHPKADQIRAHVEKNPNAFTREDTEIVKAIYPPEKTFMKLMEGDIERFTKALAQTGAAVEPEPILALTLRYEGELDLPLAAAELGFTPADLQARLKRSPRLARALGALNTQGGNVQREAFLEILPNVLSEFQLGEGLRFYPLSTVTNTIPEDPNFRPFVGHKGHILAVELSPDGKRILTGSEDMTARLWDLATGREIRPFAGHTDEVLAIAFSPDGKRVLTGSADRTARLWDPASGRQLHKFDAHTERVSAVAFSPDGKRALTGSWDQSISLWDLATGKELHRLNGHSSYVTAVAFTPDGKQAVSAGYDGTIRVWDLKSGNQVLRLTGHNKEVYSIAVSPNGKWLASGGNDRTVRYWNLKTGKEARVFKGHGQAVVRVAFSKDGKHILSASSQYQGSAQPIRIWDTKGKLVHSAGGKGDTIWSLCFAPDGKLAVSGTAARSLRLWKLP